MGKYDGKTLLVLGSNVGAVDMVQYAKENGAVILAADYYPPERSEVKRYADRHYLVSTADIEKLNEIIQKESVDAVISGISEFNTLKAMELSRLNHLPFYCTKEQWDSVESKDHFRRLCEQNGVPCPQTYFNGTEIPDDLWETFQYPLVLKPVDACASSGVYICRNENELRTHIADAIGHSERKTIIIEEFVRGNEFTAHYTISGGKAALACIDNRYPIALHEGNVTTIPIARIYPSVFAEDYLEKVNASVVRMCESINVQDAILFVQGIHDPETGAYRIFEAGLRCAGEAPYRFLKEVTGDTFIRILVDHALLGSSDYKVSAEQPLMNGKCGGIVSFAGHHGVVGAVSGLDQLNQNELSILSIENRYPAGREVPDTDTLRQLMVRFVMLCDNRDKLAESIAKINDSVSITNTAGDSMIEKFDPQRLYGEF